MTVEEEIESHKRVEAHWQAIGLEEKKKRRRLYREAVAESSRIAESCVATGKITEDFLEAEARVDEAAIAYYGE